MISAIHAAVSGVHAASRSLAARADNIANLRTTSRVADVSKAPASDDGVFRPYRVVNVARTGGGVDTTVEAIEPSHAVIYDPRDSRADAAGRVALPNVNLGEELAGMALDRHLFLASLTVIRTVDDMAGALLNEQV